MKKGDRVFREILYRVYEQGERFMSQKTLAQVCELSLGSVNPLIARLGQLGAIEKKPLGFRVIDPKKILLYWAGKRNLPADVVYSTRSPLSVSSIEVQMPPGAILTGCSGYRIRFGDVPAEYDEVYVYADPRDVKRKFPAREVYRKNVFVLRSDPHLERLSEGGIVPLAQLYVDLWQLGAPANRFVDELERKLELAQVGALEAMIRKVREKKS
jgi:hypothetical protein